MTPDMKDLKPMPLWWWYEGDDYPAYIRYGGQLRLIESVQATIDGRLGHNEVIVYFDDDTAYRTVKTDTVYVDTRPAAQAADLDPE